MKKALSLILAIAFLTATLSGCATRSKNIDPMYVNSGKYARYNCAQLAEEQDKVISKVNAMSKKQDAEATKDAVALTVGLVIFWPALIFMLGSDKKQELSRLKGEYEAVQDAMIMKQCSIPKTIENADRG
jgi:hypothetical protein